MIPVSGRWARGLFTLNIKTCLYLRMLSMATLLADLRAMAEPSRLRLLAILARGEFSVSELTAVLGQSQPRVSRHLKLLCDAGLLERFREQHWIFYRVPSEGRGGEFARELLTRLDPDDPILARDADRVARVLEARREAASPQAGPPGAAGQAELNAVLAAELGDTGRDALFLLRRRTCRRAECDCHARAACRRHARFAARCAGRTRRLALARPQSLRIAAGAVDGTAATLRELRPCDRRPLAGWASAPGGCPARSGPAAARRRPGAARRGLRRTSAARGDRAIPSALVREWLAEAGLLVTRLHPVDLDGRHLLLAVATSERIAAAAA